MDKAVIITTINGITEPVSQFLQHKDWDIIIVADEKTQHIDDTDNENLIYLDLDSQTSLAPDFDDFMPYNHYCRKNLGYLYAIKEGYDRIVDTDDDNMPYEDWSNWEHRIEYSNKIVSPKFPNIYNIYTDKYVWPRGYPLWKISDDETIEVISNSESISDIAIIQGLADKEPDVDAIFRLIFDKEIIFNNSNPVVLDDYVYCPFNSQNTYWKRIAYPYLYLPTTVSFRFTDILRGYIAQRGLWEIGKKLAFTDATVVQDRNIHDLMEDFISEIPCYTQLATLIDILDSISLKGSPTKDLVIMYEELAKNEIVKEEEIKNIKSWISNIENYLK